MSAPTDPVYLRVLEDLRERIRGGVLKPGARVPSRNAIIANYGVGETAAKHALQVLASEGLIEARTGSGSYVRRMPAASCLEHDRLRFPGSPFGLDERAPDGDGGGPHSARRLTWEHQTELVVPPPYIARRLGLEPGRLTAGTPVELPEQGPLAGRGVIERMASIGIKVDEVAEEVSVRPSLRSESAALGLPGGAPALVIERLHLASGEPVEAGEIVIAADRFRLRYRFAVPAGGQP